jgi:putative inorganic carbon (HCO3(-)) transporter
MLGLAAYLRSPGALAPKDLLVSSGVPVVETPSLESMESRLDLWSRAVYAIQDFPLTGMGMDVFQQVVHRLYPLYLIQITTTPAHAHNQYLQIAIDLGLPGLVAFLALNIGAFVMLARLARLARLAKLAKLARLARQSREEGNTHLVLVYGLGGGLAASLLHGFLDAAAMVSKAWFLFWLVLGLVAGLYARQVVKGSPAGSTDTSQTPQSQ